MRSSRGSAVAMVPPRTSLQKDIALRSDAAYEHRTRRWTTIRAVCKGTTPLLMHAMNDVPWGYGGPCTCHTQPRTPKSLEEMAAERLYKDADGNVGIPAVNLFAALRFAGRAVQFRGRKMVSAAERSSLSSFLAIEEEFLLFPRSTTWVVDRRIGRMKKGFDETRVGIVRPRFDEWGFRATIRADLTQVSVELVRELFRKAGIHCGLCSFRPACNGTYGQFKVTAFRIV